MITKIAVKSSERGLLGSIRFGVYVPDMILFDSTHEALTAGLEMLRIDIEGIRNLLNMSDWEIALKFTDLSLEVFELYSNHEIYPGQYKYLGADYFYHENESGMLILEYDCAGLTERAFIPRTQCNIIAKDKPLADLKKDSAWVKAFIKGYINEDV